MNYTEPYIPTPEDVISKMLALAGVGPEDTVFDLGSGDGRTLIAAARDFHAKAVGVEISSRLVKECRRRVREMGLSSRVSIRQQSFKKTSLRRADVLALYLSSYTLYRLAPKFAKELRPGVRIVNFDFPIPDRRPRRKMIFKPAGWKKAHPLYLYIV